MKRDEPVIYSELIAKIVRGHSMLKINSVELFGAGKNEVCGSILTRHPSERDKTLP
jgi:hypothetical protein